MTRLFRFNCAAIGALMLATFGAASLGVVAASAQAVPDYAALIAAPDRSAADREADKRRDPVPFLAFAGLRPGMKVLDMGAGGGYSTELAARAVAPNGIAYGQNPPGLFERAQAALAARLMTPGMKNGASLVRPFDDPAPADMHDLDWSRFCSFTTTRPILRSIVHR